MNEIHEYEIKSFSKTHEFNPDLSKTIFSTNEHILYQNHRIDNLEWPKQIYTQYRVPSLAKNNLCSVCN